MYNLSEERCVLRGEVIAVYQCFHCLAYTVVWDSDADLEDLGCEDQGIIHFCHCTNCGAEIEYIVRINEKESCE